MTNDGSNTYTWDRANRMVGMSTGATTYSYAYDGDGNRMSQTVNSTVTNYLLDVQPELVMVLQSTQGTDVTNYIHNGFGGIHSKIRSFQGQVNTNTLVADSAGKYLVFNYGTSSGRGGQVIVDGVHMRVIRMAARHYWSDGRKMTGPDTGWRIDINNGVLTQTQHTIETIVP